SFSTQVILRSSRIPMNSWRHWSNMCGRWRFRANARRLRHLFAVLRIERVDEAVAEEVEAHHGGHDCRAGKNRQMIRQAEVAAAGGEHRPPRRRRRLHAEAEK